MIVCPFCSFSSAHFNVDIQNDVLHKICPHCKSTVQEYKKIEQ